MTSARRHAKLQEVADAAGVSIATASRALSGEKVNAKNMRLVQDAAKQLAYVPNIAAHSLHSARTMSAAIVLPAMGNVSTELV